MPSLGFRTIAARIKTRSEATTKSNKKLKSDPVVPEPTPVGTAWEIFRIWLLIGLQSFGGGATTSLLIRREMIYKRGWFSQEEYSQMWTLCNLSPGINLFAFAIIMGKRLAGWPGSLACLSGMTLPSATVTTLITAGFTSVQDWPPLQAMLHGIIPAIIGISFVFVVQFAVPIFKQSLREGKSSLALNMVWAATCAILLGIFKLSAVVVFIISAFAAAIIFPRILPDQPPPLVSKKTETQE